MKARIPIIISLLTLTALMIFLRQPTYQDIFCNPDVATMAYGAEDLLAGGVIYDRCLESKPPGAHIVTAISFWIGGRTMTSVYVAATLFHIVTMLLLYLLGSRMHSKFAGIATAYLYAFHSISFGAAGHCPNFETWTVLPVTAGYFFLWEADRQQRRKYPLFLAGLFGGIAIIFKQMSAVFCLFAIGYIALTHREIESRKERIGATIMDSLIAAAGALIPLLMMVLFFAWRGGLAPLWSSLNPGAGLGYAGSTDFSLLQEHLRHHLGYYLWHSFTLVAMAAAILFAFRIERDDFERSKHRLARLLVLVWLISATFAVAAGTKFFDHYYVMLTPPLALAAGIAMAHLIAHGGLPRPLKALLIVVLLLSAPLDMWQEIHVAEVALHERRTSDRIDFTELREKWFLGRASIVRESAWSREQQKVGECIAKQTDPDDGLYVWDYLPGIYWYANRRSPTRHYVYFETTVDVPSHGGTWFPKVTPQVRDNRDKLLSDLGQKPPAYVVELPDGGDGQSRKFIIEHAPMFSELRRFVDEHYSINMQCSTRHITARRLIQ